eukprot:SM005284S17842  [mRNA]  locus=s5284:10:502:- [translate_table: standard]
MTRESSSDYRLAACVQAAMARKKGARMADEAEYEQLVEVENTNRVEALIDARNLDEALSQMALAEDSPPGDKHPERRLKAAYKAFEEAELPRLRAERPGMSLTQYKDLLWKLWKKSPSNPLNAPAAATAAAARP